MKIKDGFVLRTIISENVVTPEGADAVNFNKIIVLNSSAAFLWNKVLGKEFDADTLRDLLLEEYEVDEATAAKDAAALLDSWLKAGVVE